MLSKEDELQKEYEHYLKNHLPDGFSFVEENHPYPAVYVVTENAKDSAKMIEEELRLNGYSEDMVKVEHHIDETKQGITFSFDLLFFTEEQAKSCLLLIARTLYHIETSSDKEESSSFFSIFKSKRKVRKRDDDKFKDDITKEEVVKAVRTFSDNLPKGTYRTILVHDDYSIDFDQLRRYLPRTPTQKFYMSKETYEIFEEHECHIPPLMDKVQQAVDQYVKLHKEYPILPYDNLHRVNGYLLVQEKLLDEVPNIEFYITNYDGLVSHKKPKK